MNRSKKLAVTLCAAALTVTAAAGSTAGQLLSPMPVHAENDFISLTAHTEADDALTGGYLPDIKGITNKAMPSIVAITNAGKETISYFGRLYEQDSESSGSGIIVGQNSEELLIATNNHVVKGAEELTVLFSVDAENEEDLMASAKVKGTDSSLDLAVVAVRIEDIPAKIMDQIAPIELGDSDAIDVGDWTIAIGNALGYGQSVTFGIVSALNREISLSTDSGVISNSMIQTDAAINFGNSGGALLDENGRLIGINSAKAAETGVEGMGYAIPINSAKPIIEDLMNQTTRSIVDSDKSGVLGIRVTDVSEEARELYSIPAGAYVYETTEGGAAAQAGICKGDIIVKLERTSINSMNELLDRIQYYEAGEEVEVTVKRNDGSGYEEQVITVTLQARETEEKEAGEEVDSTSGATPEEEGQENYDRDYRQERRSGRGSYEDLFGSFFGDYMDGYGEYNSYNSYSYGSEVYPGFQS